MTKILITLIAALLVGPAVAGEWRDNRPDRTDRYERRDHSDRREWGHNRGRHYGHQKRWREQTHRYYDYDRDRYQRDWRAYRRYSPQHEMWQRSYIPGGPGIYISPRGADVIIPQIIVPIR